MRAPLPELSPRLRSTHPARVRRPASRARILRRDAPTRRSEHPYGSGSRSHSDRGRREPEAETSAIVAETEIPEKTNRRAAFRSQRSDPLAQRSQHEVTTKRSQLAQSRAGNRTNTDLASYWLLLPTLSTARSARPTPREIPQTDTLLRSPASA